MIGKSTKIFIIGLLGLLVLITVTGCSDVVQDENDAGSQKTQEKSKPDAQEEREALTRAVFFREVEQG